MKIEGHSQCVLKEITFLNYPRVWNILYQYKMIFLQQNSSTSNSDERQTHLTTTNHIFQSRRNVQEQKIKQLIFEDESIFIANKYCFRKEANILKNYTGLGATGHMLSHIDLCGHTSAAHPNQCIECNPLVCVMHVVCTRLCVAAHGGKILGNKFRLNNF